MFDPTSTEYKITDAINSRGELLYHVTTPTLSISLLPVSPNEWGHNFQVYVRCGCGNVFAGHAFPVPSFQEGIDKALNVCVEVRGHSTIQRDADNERFRQTTRRPRRNRRAA